MNYDAASDSSEGISHKPSMALTEIVPATQAIGLAHMCMCHFKHAIYGFRVWEQSKRCILQLANEPFIDGNLCSLSEMAA